MLIHETTTTTIHVVDEADPHAGGAFHRYQIRNSETGQILCEIDFQHGPVGEAGVNGVQHVDLLHIVQHRLDSFQRGPFASPTNEVTCGFVGAAIASEGTRTRRRNEAGVEGTSRKAPGVES